MPRTESKCGYCREVGHDRRKCDTLELDKVLQISGEPVLKDVRKIKVGDTYVPTLEYIATFQLLKQGKIPFVIFRVHKQLSKDVFNGIRKIAYENNKFIIVERIDYSDENCQTIEVLTNEYKESIKEYKTFIDEEYKSYINKAKKITDELKGRLNYRGKYIPQTHFSTSNLNEIFHGDFETTKEKIAEEQRVYNIQQSERNEKYRREQQEYQIRHKKYIVGEVRRLGLINEEIINTLRQQLREEQTTQNIQEDNRIMQRPHLPVINDTPYEATECPVCYEDLGDTNKIILRCGHQMCSSCMITHTLRHASSLQAKCPTCRVAIM